LENTHKFSDKYDEKTVSIFDEKLKKLYETIDGNKNYLRTIFLKLYAHPVYNKGL